MLAKGEELAGGCGGLRQRVAWSPVHCGWGAICLLQCHSPSSILGIQPFLEYPTVEDLFDFVFFDVVVRLTIILIELVVQSSKTYFS